MLRKEIKLSPKSKLSPANGSKGKNLRKLAKSKSTPPIKRDLKRDLKTKSDTESTPSKKLKSGPLIEPNRIRKLISAIEENITLEGADPKLCEKEKIVAENAFTRLMKINGGENSPSPGRKRTKRLKSVKPHGLQKLDGWLKIGKN